MSSSKAALSRGAPWLAALGLLLLRPVEGLAGEAERPARVRQPLLVLAGLGGARSEVSLEALRQGVASGGIAVLDPVAPAARQALGVDVKRMLPDATAFLPEARKGGLLLSDLEHCAPRLRALKLEGHDFFSEPARYPLYTGDPGDAPPDSAAQLARFVLTGVTAITRATGQLADARGIHAAYERVLPWFAGATWVHVSNEVSLEAGCSYGAHGGRFCTKERDLAQALRELGVGVVELTGNHLRDFGPEPLRATLGWLHEHGYRTFGGGLTPEDADAPLVLPLPDGRRLGLLGYNEGCPLGECAGADGEPGANRYSDAKARAGLRRLRAMKVDFIMVGVQFVESDSAEPRPEQRRIARLLVDEGADLVYGSQAHQLQQVELYKGRPIYYGLGNFLFDQIHRESVRQAFFLQLYFWEGRLVQAVPVFTFMSDDRRLTPATPRQEAAMRAVIYRDGLLYAP